MKEQEKRVYQMAFDAGGTMTDCFLADDAGNWQVAKYLTNRDDQSISYRGALKAACVQAKLEYHDVQKQCISNVYCGTHMLNTMLTGEGQKVGLLVSIGQHDTPFLERGLTWLEQDPFEKWKYQLHSHTKPMIAPKDVKAVTERIASGNYFPPGTHLTAGDVVIPLNEAEVVKAVEELLDDNVEVIGICFLNSFVNPTHEHRAAEIAREIIKKRGLNINVICSADICPRSKESTRMKSILVECFTTEKTRRGLFLVEKAAKEDGFRFNLRTFLGYGAIADIRYPRLFESVVSGPVGGLLGAKAASELLGTENIICADLGGTSWDVGTLIEGQLTLNNDPGFAGHRLNMAMLNLDSAGLGCGTEIHVNPVSKRISLGPRSAGFRLGACYEFWPNITITDVNLALRLLDPDNFLGGTVKVDREKSIQALTENLAKPLGMDLYKAARGVLDLHAAMLQEHINVTVLPKGYDPEKYVLLVYGGGGPLHLWGVEKGMKFAAQATVPWAPAFSAFGVVMADYLHHYEKSVSCSLHPTLSREDRLEVCKPMNKAWENLEEIAIKELEAEGFKREQIVFQYGIAARYIGQLFSSWLAPVELTRVNTVDDVDAITLAFEKTYQRIYPTVASSADAGYLITSVYLDAYAPKPKVKFPKYTVKDKKPAKAAYKGTRDVFWEDKWVKTELWNMDLLEAGNQIDGPAILDNAVMTLPIPAGKRVNFDEHKVIWYKNQ